jgi:hypothetical protein
VASEALSGTLFFEIGSTMWGKADTTNNRNFSAGGGALGADNTGSIKLRRAYLDWMPPESDLKIRMGIQGIDLPSFTTTSMVFSDDVAGITASYKVNDNVGITAVWARPYNDNYSDTTGGNWINGAYRADRDNYMDNVAAFALLIPLSFDGVKVTPWAMYAALGPNWNASSMSSATSYGQTTGGMLPAGGARHKDGSSAAGTRKLSSYGDALWLGLTGEVTAFDPFRIAWDFNYGSVAWSDDGRLNRQGWLVSLLFEYKLDWGIPGLYGWYASGDDSDPSNGSERLPYASVGNNTNGYSFFAGTGALWNHGDREGVMGRTWNGTWGIGARLKDFYFVEDLKHTLYINYIGGTNSPTMARKMSRDDIYDNGWDWAANGAGNGMEKLYLTTMDSALEIGLRNVYKMYDNFSIYLEGGYIATFLDHGKGAWGRSDMNGRGEDKVKDPWNINLAFVYQF